MESNKGFFRGSFGFVSGYVLLSTMVNHYQTTIWEIMFGTFPGIEHANPSVYMEIALIFPFFRQCKAPRKKHLTWRITPS